MSNNSEARAQERNKITASDFEPDVTACTFQTVYYTRGLY